MNPKVLIGCEASQEVCKAFRALGIEAYSNDIEDCYGGHPEWHLKMDVFEAIEKVKPKLFIGHPPCTFITNAGIGWFNIELYGFKAIDRHRKRIDAVEFFYRMWMASVEMICLENPVGYLNSAFRKPDQIIHPNFFGDEHKKGTCLWLKNLPQLIWSKTDNLFDRKTFVEPKVLSIQYRKPGRHYKGGEEKKRYFTDAATRSATERSKTFPGIASAMASQWGKLLIHLTQTNHREK